MRFEELDQAITFSNLSEPDFPLLLDYWDPVKNGAFWESLNADLTKLSSRAVFEKFLYDAVESNKQNFNPASWIMIQFNKKTIGFHPPTHLKENVTARFHAHICDESFRGKGIALYTYPRAGKLMIERLNLKYLHYITPKHNPGPNKTKERLGIITIREMELTDTPILKPGVIGNYSEATLEQLNEIIKIQETTKKLIIKG